MSTDHMLSQRIEEVGYVPQTMVAIAAYPMQAITDKLGELRPIVRERAVLMNAEGWETGPLEFDYRDQPWDLSVKVTVWAAAWRRVNCTTEGCCGG